MMDEREIAEGRIVRAGYRLVNVRRAWLTRGSSDNDDIFAAEWESAWAEHKEASLLDGRLAGKPTRLEELRWRAWRSEFPPVDPSVQLTSSEAAELAQLEAKFRAELDELVARNDELRRQLREPK